MEDWTRGEILSLMGILIMLSPGLANILVVPKLFSRVILIISLILSVLFTVILLNSKLKKEEQQQAIIVQANPSQSDAQPQPIPPPKNENKQQTQFKTKSVSETEVEPTPDESDGKSSGAKSQPSNEPDLKRKIIGTWKINDSSETLTFEADGKTYTNGYYLGRTYKVLNNTNFKYIVVLGIEYNYEVEMPNDDFFIARGTFYTYTYTRVKN